MFMSFGSLNSFSEMLYGYLSANRKAPTIPGFLKHFQLHITKEILRIMQIFHSSNIKI